MVRHLGTSRWQQIVPCSEHEWLGAVSIVLSCASTHDLSLDYLTSAESHVPYPGPVHG